MTWEPRLPLTAAEKTVDFQAHENHILTRRTVVERLAAAPTRRLAVSVVDLGVSNIHTRAVEEALTRSLAATARFGFTQARREIRQLRAGQDVTARAVPDAGRYAALATAGLAAVLDLISHRARRTAQAVAASTGTEAITNTEPDKILRAAAAAAAGLKVLHLHVLELVGETLNLGRTAGVLSLRRPPVHAMRSEQLDKTTCDPCSRYHGEIAEVGTGAFYALLPPQGCLGGGRCRGIMVFADRIADVRAPEPAEEDLARIRRDERDRRRRRQAA